MIFFATRLLDFPLSLTHDLHMDSCTCDMLVGTSSLLLELSVSVLCSNGCIMYDESLHNILSFSQNGTVW